MGIRKKLNVVVSFEEGSWTATCEELGVNGFGETEEQALECLVISLQTVFNASARTLREGPGNLSNIAQIHQQAVAA